MEVECPNIGSHMYGQLASSGKGMKVIQWRKESLSTNGSGTPRNLYGKKMNFGTCI